jgi:hypothetical protein
MTQQTASWTPDYLPQVETLVENHRAIKAEPLLLAILYAPARNPGDAFVFEVIENFGSNSIDPDEELFEIAFDSSAGFALPTGRKLRLILTNPEELRAAVRDHWPMAEELRQTMRDGHARVIWSDPAHRYLLELVDG